MLQASNHISPIPEKLASIVNNKVAETWFCGVGLQNKANPKIPLDSKLIEKRIYRFIVIYIWTLTRNQSHEKSCISED
jgi:hypothetical protein